jgi:tetratricopeptide (TPR) repeat protein
LATFMRTSSLIQKEFCVDCWAWAKRTKTRKTVVSTETHRLCIAPPTYGQDFALQIELSYYVGRAYYYTGDYRRSIQSHKMNVDALSGSTLHESFDMECPPAILCRVFLVMCLSETGEFGLAIEHGQEALRLAEQIEHTFGSTYADFALGLTYLRMGELKTAIEVLERGMDRCRAADIPVQFPLVASPLGFAYVLTGRVAEGIELLEKAIDQTASKKRVSGQAFRVSLLSEAYLRAGRLDDAATQAALALELSQAYRERGREAWILRLMAEISRMRTLMQVEETKSQYRRAMDLAENLAMRPLVAHCHFGLGQLWAQSGHSDKALQELVAASDLYRTLNMTARLSETEAELATFSTGARMQSFGNAS